MIDYCVLGHTEKTRDRRFKALMLNATGATPIEIAVMMKVDLSTIYKDLKFLHALRAKGDPTPLFIIQAAGLEFYRAKLRELEKAAKALEPKNSNAWTACQKLILTIKETELKLQGAFIHKAEIRHEGHITTEAIDKLTEFVEAYVAPEDQAKMSAILRKKGDMKHDGE